jgi:hypothetical protein
MDLLKAAANLSNGIYDLVEWTVKRLEAPGKDISRQSALGTVAEISVAIKPGKTGEVALVIDSTLQHYPARAKQDNIEFKNGAKVRICDIVSHLMYVETVDTDFEQAKASLSKSAPPPVDNTDDACCDH